MKEGISQQWAPGTRVPVPWCEVSCQPSHTLRRRTLVSRPWSLASQDEAAGPFWIIDGILSLSYVAQTHGEAEAGD